MRSDRRSPPLLPNRWPRRDRIVTAAQPVCYVEDLRTCRVRRTRRERDLSAAAGAVGARRSHPPALRFGAGTATRIWEELQVGMVGETALACSSDWTDAWPNHYGDVVPHRFAVGEVGGESQHRPAFASALVSELRRESDWHELHSTASRRRTRSRFSMRSRCWRPGAVLVELHQQRWAIAGQPAFASPRFADFNRELVPRPLARDAVILFRVRAATAGTSLAPHRSPRRRKAQVPRPLERVGT